MVPAGRRGLQYAGNTDEFPEEPAFYFANHEPHRKLLQEQTEVSWTLFNMGWLTDCLITKKLRYIKDIGEYHPVDLNDNMIIIPGTEEELLAFTAIRDSCRAIVRLFDYEQWDPIIYVCGETTTWNMTAAVMSERIPGLKVSHRSQGRAPKENRRRRIRGEGYRGTVRHGMRSPFGACLCESMSKCTMYMITRISV